MLAAMILEISSASFNKSLIFGVFIIPSLQRQIQYLVSLADFSAISSYLINSLLELALLPSIIFAPIDVEDL
jgi:hypothetical protein